MNNNDDSTKEEIESALFHSIANGDIDLAGLNQDGELTFRITDHGEGFVAEMAGGKDVLDSASTILKLIHANGVMGFDIEGSITDYLLIVQLLKIFKHYGNWDTLLKAI